MCIRDRVLYCVRSVWTGNMALGSLWFLVAWGSQFSTTLWHIGHIEHQFNFFTPSIMGMKEALTMPVGLRVVEKPQPVTTVQSFKIEFENVGYHYEHQSEEKEPIPTLENVSFAIERGEKVALIGPSAVSYTHLTLPTSDLV